VRAAYVKRRVRLSGGIAGTSKTDVRLNFESLFFRRGRLFEEAVNKLSGRQGAGRSGAAPVSQSVHSPMHPFWHKLSLHTTVLSKADNRSAA